MFIAKEQYIDVLSNGLHISPANRATFSEELNNCHQQLEQIINELDRYIVLIIYFIDAPGEKVYYDLAASIESVHGNYYKSPCSVIAQSPADGKKVNVEVYHCAREATPEFRQFEGFPYCVFNYKKDKYLVAGGLRMRTGKADLLKQSTESFRLMSAILDRENMDFSNIFRQWNYIESITDSVECSQRYQIFNDVRSTFYNEAVFKNGYPAATGIGMNTGGIIIDFLASAQEQVWPVKNPEQVDAHKYSGEVLGDNKSSGKFIKSSPKFERAKAITMDENILLFVSGTAAIKGQHSIAQNDAYRQTLVTVDNLRQLTSIENIIANDIPVDNSSVVEPISFRIYSKSSADIPKVRAAFESVFGILRNVQYLIADICRPELLVEIEGTYRIRKS